MNTQTKPVYLNKSELARRLDRAPKTIEERLIEGVLEGDASTPRGLPLFDASRLETIRQLINSTGNVSITC